MLTNAYENAYDVAILLSGDADFIPAIKKIGGLHKKIDLWCFKESVAWMTTQFLKNLIKTIYFVGECFYQNLPANNRIFMSFRKIRFPRRVPFFFMSNTR